MGHIDPPHLTIKNETMRSILTLLLIIAISSCSHNSETEKHQSKRDNIINVEDSIIEVDISDITQSAFYSLSIIDDYLIIGDFKSYNEHLIICDKHTFKCVARAAQKGRGPGEITNMGHLGVNEKDREFYVSDHGRNQVFKYDLDSLISNPKYLPSVKLEMHSREFLSEYQLLNDTLSIGAVILPTGNSGFNQKVGKWNMNSGKIEIMKYEHPNIAKKSVSVTASPTHNIYVEGHSRHDLMTICNLDGELKYNIYGENWDTERTDKEYFSNIRFYKDKIIALYKDGNIGSNTVGAEATQFLVFDINGDYIKTLETGYNVIIFTIDTDANRVLMVVDDEDTTFAYLEIGELLD